MATIVRAATLRGRLIEGARWRIDGAASLREKDKIVLSISIPKGAHEILAHMSKTESLGRMLDGDAGKFSAEFPFEVKDVQRVLDVDSGSVSTLVTVVPENRTVEGAMLQVMAARPRSNPRG